MSLVLGLDFETTGLDPEKDRVVEVGLALWDTVLRRPAAMIDFFVDPGPYIDDQRWAEAEAIHLIPRGLVRKFGMSEKDAVKRINSMALQAEFIVAHNGTDFDALFYAAMGRRNTDEDLAFRPWVDTRIDVPEPMNGKLVCIAAQRGFLNPFPHNALSDVLTMLRVLDSYDFAKVLERARVPNMLVEFVGPFASKDHAKQNGFYWNGYDKARPTKQWLKRIKATDFEAEARAAKPYSIREVRQK